jgi:hypothetical protein
MQLPKHHVLIGCAIFDRVISFPTCQIKSNFAKNEDQVLDEQSCKNLFVGETHHLIFILALLALSIEVYFNWLLLLKSIKTDVFQRKTVLEKYNLALSICVYFSHYLSLLSDRINNCA